MYERIRLLIHTVLYMYSGPIKLYNRLKKMKIHADILEPMGRQVIVIIVA
jgi:hypothetical protein